MKILKFASYYPLYLDQFYKQNNFLKFATYSEQLRILNRDAFGWADFWSNALQDTDTHIIELTVNNVYLQKAWADEHNSTYIADQWYDQILKAQVAYYKPDILFFEDRNINRSLIRELKSLNSSLWATIAWCGTPFINVEEFSEFDAVLGCIPDVNAKLSEAGIRVFQLDHAFDSRILNRLSNIAAKAYDFSFIGQIINNDGMHSNRFKYLDFLSKKTNLTIFSPQIRDLNLLDRIKDSISREIFDSSTFIKKNAFLNATFDKTYIGKKIIHLSKPLAKIPKNIKEKSKPAVYGLEMFKTMQQSSVSFNIHIDASKHSASNMRLFEATGVGSCLLTDSKDNLQNFFKDGIEIMSYSSKEDCLEKFVWLQKHPEQREEIAKNGQKKTLTFHTFNHRARDLQQILKKVIK